MTPEQIRHHAAGHLAAAALIAMDSPNAAQLIISEVVKFADDPKVETPPIIKQKLREAADDPCNHLMTLRTLEMSFCHPFNTQIEHNGGRF